MIILNCKEKKLLNIPILDKIKNLNKFKKERFF